jgi:ABC-type antimicrobial peptide transport system permease subunit
MDPELPLRRVETLEERADRMFWFVALIGSIFSVFGFAALFLASVGLYGVVAHSVSRRTRETGIRMALGATQPSVLWLFFWNGLRQVGLGLIGGGILAFWGSRLLASVLFGVRAGDPATMGVVAVVLLASASAAILIPAFKATRSSPVDALRGE